MFYVRLRTTHYSFSIKNTCVVRSLQSFYQLRGILKVRFPLSDQLRVNRLLPIKRKID